MEVDLTAGDSPLLEPAVEDPYGFGVDLFSPEWDAMLAAQGPGGGPTAAEAGSAAPLLASSASPASPASSAPVGWMAPPTPTSPVPGTPSGATTGSTMPATPTPPAAPATPTAGSPSSPPTPLVQELLEMARRHGMASTEPMVSLTAPTGKGALRPFAARQSPYSRPSPVPEDPSEALDAEIAAAMEARAAVFHEATEGPDEE